MRKIDFSQRNENPIKNSKSLENSIDNSYTDIQLQSKAAICDKFLPAKFPIPATPPIS